MISSLANQRVLVGVLGASLVYCLFYAVSSMLGWLGTGTDTATTFRMTTPLYTIRSPEALPYLLGNATPGFVLIAHFFNEEFLMPYFIEQHRDLFDAAIFIDWNSTDSSRKIFMDHAPPSWAMVRTSRPFFDTRAIDQEVEEYEGLFPNSWKLALTLTEFVVFDNDFRASLSAHSRQGNKILRLPSFMMVGDDKLGLRPECPLVLQRNLYAPSLCGYYVGNTAFREESNNTCIAGVTYVSRFLHKLASVTYPGGRHHNPQPHIDVPFVKGAFLAKFKYTPWPQVKKRKTNMRNRASPLEVRKGAGGYHQFSDEKIDKEKEKASKEMVETLAQAPKNGNNHQQAAAAVYSQLKSMHPRC